MHSTPTHQILHSSSNRAWCRATLLLETNRLTTTPHHHLCRNVKAITTMPPTSVHPRDIRDTTAQRRALNETPSQSYLSYGITQSYLPPDNRHK